MQQIKNLKGKSNADFLNDFPFEHYLDSFSLINIKELEQQRLYLNSIGIEGDVFVRKIAENYAKRIRLNFEEFDSVKYHLMLADIWQQSEFFLPDSVKIYQRWSDLWFNTIADSISVLLENETINKNQFYVLYVLEKLKERQYIPNIPANNTEKLFNYIIEGKFGYIWYKCLTTYRNAFVVFCIVVLFFAVTYIWFGISFFHSLRKKKTNE